MRPKRQTAYKFWIKDVLSGEQKLTNEGLRYFQVKDKEVVRVNFIAVVINKYESMEKNYTAITLDDGSGQIRLKTWEDDTRLLGGVKVGDIILAIGRLHEMNGETFLRPEVTKKMEAEWALIRKLELEKEFGNLSNEGKVLAIAEERVEEKPEPSIVAREKVYQFVESAPDEGIEVNNLVSRTGLNEGDVEKAIEELLREGEIFNPRPGFVKIV